MEPLWGVSSVGRAPALQAGCRRFEPDTFHYIFLPELRLVEHPIVNRVVPGSSPGGRVMEAQEIGDSIGLENRGSSRAWGFDSLRFRSKFG